MSVWIIPEGSGGPTPPPDTPIPRPPDNHRVPDDVEQRLDDLEADIKHIESEIANMPHAQTQSGVLSNQNLRTFDDVQFNSVEINGTLLSSDLSGDLKISGDVQVTDLHCDRATVQDLTVEGKPMQQHLEESLGDMKVDSLQIGDCNITDAGGRLQFTTPDETIFAGDLETNSLSVSSLSVQHFGDVGALYGSLNSQFQAAKNRIDDIHDDVKDREDSGIPLLRVDALEVLDSEDNTMRDVDDRLTALSHDVATLVATESAFSQDGSGVDVTVEGLVARELYIGTDRVATVLDRKIETSNHFNYRVVKNSPGVAAIFDYDFSSTLNTRSGARPAIRFNSGFNGAEPAIQLPSAIPQEEALLVRWDGRTRFVGSSQPDTTWSGRASFTDFLPLATLAQMGGDGLYQTDQQSIVEKIVEIVVFISPRNQHVNEIFKLIFFSPDADPLVSGGLVFPIHAVRMMNDDLY